MSEIKKDKFGMVGKKWRISPGERISVPINVTHLRIIPLIKKAQFCKCCFFENIGKLYASEKSIFWPINMFVAEGYRVVCIITTDDFSNNDSDQEKVVFLPEISDEVRQMHEQALKSIQEGIKTS
ncbi:MAG: hypothetical protein COU81_02290 [Candidatus Portnoybacteria bacterium CG10_big_fil_rev_8_21_14_0_10_36_7]|uniref:Uncharacterized protein n=1 Tax=Candidatus Portnoybacteria bacterium CG10_big_fil_rev_8_21_14_0_10_36_7 TaxID=1974812 RepID=A0A2M8KE10_9BACT|nr:MAG: hypothetical protein COU81_02290 [Candidatus Portnoybacteria bacterium CG10_big_fil_rev_8_21_14_0_10_36_7]